MKTQLARFLAGEPATKDLVVLVGAGASGDTARGTGDVYTPDTGSGGSTRWGGWPILSGAVALGLIGAGVYLYSIDETCSDGSTDPGCPDLRHTADSGNYTMVGGAVFVGVTVVLILTRPKSSAAKSAFIVPTRDGAMAGMSMSF